MAITAVLQGRVRFTAPPAYTSDGASVNVDCNPRGEMIVTQGLPARAELVRQGNSWSVSIPTGSAFTPVAAWPTTLTNIGIFNNEPAGGKSYIIDSAWVAAITSVAAASSITLLGQMVIGPAAPSDTTTALRVSRSGKTSYGGRSLRAVATTTAVASQWDVLAAVAASPSASIGAGVYADLYGYYIVPPGSMFAVNAVFSTAAGTAIQGIGWHEVQLQLP